MTTTIAPILRHELSDLIPSLDGGRLSVKEVAIFRGYVLASSVVWQAVVKGELYCIWGLIPPTLLSDRAYLWLHTTEAVEGNEFVLVRRSQIELAKMLEQFPTIVGHCAVDAARSIRWLGWLGAVFGPPEGKLIPFVIRSKV